MNRTAGLAAVSAGLIATLGLASGAYATPLAASDGGGPVFADILVELDLPTETQGPLVFFVEGVEVTADVELHVDEFSPEATENPSGYCGGAYVDIAADLSSVTLGGGDGYCNFEEAYFEIQLDGAVWQPVTLVSDTLFEDFDVEQGDEAQQASFIMGLSSGGKGISASRVMFATPPLPSLSNYGVEGNSFGAYWLGTVSSQMDGFAIFTFGTAGGANPVDEEADFAG